MRPAPWYTHLVQKPTPAGASEFLSRAMQPGTSTEGVVEGLCLAAAAAAVDGGQPRCDAPTDDGTLAARVARHAARLLASGATVAAALDDALVLALYAGESAALRAGGGDPAGVRPIAETWADYPDRILAAAPRGPAGLANPRHNLQLMVTRRCQLRCDYCPVVKRDADMPQEVLDAAVDRLLTGEQREQRLDFSGGEPLLRPGAVLRAAERFQRGTQAAGKRGSCYMVTNGFRLTSSLARELSGLGFRIELSLDGDEALHNRYKTPLNTAENPYRRTRAAIETAIEAGLPYTVVMVATPETSAQLPAGFAHAMEIGVRSIDVNYAIGREWTPSAAESFGGALREIVHTWRPQLLDRTLELGNLSSRVEPAVLNAEWMVDVDGSLHLMTEWALESSRPLPAVAGRGRVQDVRCWDQLYAGRFHGYLALLQAYSWRDEALRRVLHNNVGMGRRMAGEMAALRGELR